MFTYVNMFMQRCLEFVYNMFTDLLSVRFSSRPRCPKASLVLGAPGDRPVCRLVEQASLALDFSNESTSQHGFPALRDSLRAPGTFSLSLEPLCPPPRSRTWEQHPYSGHTSPKKALGPFRRKIRSRQATGERLSGMNSS